MPTLARLPPRSPSGSARPPSSPDIGTPTTSSRLRPAGETGLLAVLFLAGLSLRPQLVGAGPLIPDIQRDLALSHAAAGLMGTIPVACMGVFGLVAPWIAARFGSAMAVLASIGCIGAFGLARSGAADGPGLIALTTGVGIGMGVGGAVLPIFVRERLPGRPVPGTIAYSAGIQLGSAASAAVAVPLAIALGGWRGPLAVFSIATIGLLVPWLGSRVRPRHRGSRPLALTLRDFVDPRGWRLAVIFGMFGVVYYGLVSWLPDAYAEAGWAPVATGLLITALNLASLAGALTIGGIAGRLLSHQTTLATFGALFAVAAAGFVLLPEAGVAWAALAGYANGALFPLILALPLRLAVGSARAAALSSLMIGLGYSIAAVSPVLLGGIRDASGSFRISLAALAGVAAAFAVAVTAASRWKTTEDLEVERPA